MQEYGIDRFTTKYGLAAENVAKDFNYRASNNNWPREYLVGPGNRRWEPPPFENGSEAEIQLWATALRVMQDLIAQCGVAIKETNVATNHAAVYVIGDVYAEYVKIGVAVDPIARLAQLQTGNPNKLFLHRVFWIPDVEAAYLVESAAHATASDLYDRMVGEWFRCNPNEAHEVVEASIFDTLSGKPYCAITPLHTVFEAA